MPPPLSSQRSDPAIDGELRICVYGVCSSCTVSKITWQDVKIKKGEMFQHKLKQALFLYNTQEQRWPAGPLLSNRERTQARLSEIVNDSKWYKRWTVKVLTFHLKLQLKLGAEHCKNSSSCLKIVVDCSPSKSVYFWCLLRQNQHIARFYSKPVTKPR